MTISLGDDEDDSDEDKPEQKDKSGDELTFTNALPEEVKNNNYVKEEDKEEKGDENA